MRKGEGVEASFVAEVGGRKKRGKLMGVDLGGERVLVCRGWKKVERGVRRVAGVGLKKRKGGVKGAALDGCWEDGVDDACCLLHGCDKRC